MQTAWSGGAGKGCRWRDQIPYWISTDPEFLANRPSFNPSFAEPGRPDCARRILASRGVGQLFAADTSPDAADYGAGPLVPLPGGNDASAIPVLPTHRRPDRRARLHTGPQRRYRPCRLGILNTSNVANGDLVVGSSTGPTGPATPPTRTIRRTRTPTTTAAISNYRSRRRRPPSCGGCVRTPLWNVTNRPGGRHRGRQLRWSTDLLSFRSRHDDECAAWVFLLAAGAGRQRAVPRRSPRPADRWPA